MLLPSELLTTARAIDVLLVEDSDDDALIVRKRLDAAFAVTRATTLADALSTLAELDGTACVLLDLSLPDADGLEGINAIRRDDPQVPIVVLTGYDDEQLGVEAMAAGAQDYLVKGRIDGDVLPRAVRYSVERGSVGAALAEVRERFRRTFEDAPLGIALVDCHDDRGRIIEANRTLGSILGHDYEGLVGRSVDEFTHWEDRAAQRGTILEATSGAVERYSADRRLIHASGRVVSCTVNGSAVRDGLGRLLYGITVVDDVTERRRQEEELREAHAALDNAVLGIALNSLSGRCKTVNGFYARTLGYEPSELVGVTWDRLIHPDDWETFRDAIGRAIRGERANVEVRGLRKDGSSFAKEAVLMPNFGADGALNGYFHFARDVTERQRSRRALEQSEEQYRSIIETVNDGICLVDRNAIVTFVNGRVCEMLGREADELTGAPFTRFLHPSEMERALEAFEERRRGISGRTDYRFVRSDGTDVWMLVSTAPQLDDGEFVGALTVLSDITERKRAEAELARMALTDTLTGLPNRAALEQRLREEIAGGGTGVSLLFLDLDRFKRVNDAFGHDVGDELLQEVALRLTAVLRDGDVLARFGGDEFVVLCHRVDDEAAVRGVADRLLAALDEPVRLSVGFASVTASVGIASMSEAARTAEDVLRDGDIAMYRAKEAGGAGTAFFDVSMRRAVIEDVRLEQELRRALTQDDLTLAFQPILRLPDESVAGFEALLRWVHPTRGFISPAEFIPIAERTGLIIDIGRWVLAETCRRIVDWSASSGVEWGRVTVNVSARQVDDPGFVEDVRRIVSESGIEPSRLVLEITETALFSKDPGSTEATLRALADMGLKVLLDDFGTGYSSLSYLSRFKLDGLKLDRSFISGVESDPAQRAIVEAVTAMAQSLGLQLVGEGVETVAQASFLASLGCDLAQGFLFARPMPHEEVGAWIASRERHLPEGPAGVAAEPAGAWMSMGDAAQALGVSASTLRRWSDEGRIRTQRTAGGHRRFSVPDLKRLTHTGAQPRIRRGEAPSHPMPAVAALLDADGERLAGLVADRLYDKPALGWYATDRARRPIRQWVDAVTRAFRRGDFGDVDESTATLVRHAEIGGASHLESTLFVERFLASVVKVFQRPGGAADCDPATLGRAATAIRLSVAAALQPS